MAKQEGYGLGSAPASLQLPSEDMFSSPFSNWQIVKEDPVNYVDQHRRGLQFVVGLVREMPDNSIASPLNKNVSIYQKMNKDFVVISKSGNNPNDIRIFEITSEEYNEIGGEVDPDSFIRRVIEMADGSGCMRTIEEFADYGKSNEILETAGLHDWFMDKAGLEKSPQVKSKSPLVNHANEVGEKSVAGAIQEATSHFNQKPASFGEKLWGAVKGGVKGAAKGAVIGALATSAGAQSRTVGPRTVASMGAAAYAAGKLGAQQKQPKGKAGEKMQEIAAKGAVTDYLQDKKLQSQEKQTRMKTSAQKSIAGTKAGALTAPQRKNLVQTAYAKTQAGTGDWESAYSGFKPKGAVQAPAGKTYTSPQFSAPAQPKYGGNVSYGTTKAPKTIKGPKQMK